MAEKIALALTQKQENDLLAVLDGIVDIENTLIMNNGDLQNFFDENSDLIVISSKEFIPYIQNLADTLEKHKRPIDKYRSALAIAPIERLNKDSLPWLITHTMNQNFWERRVRGENEKMFRDHYAMASTAESVFNDAKRDYAEATTAEDKAAALRKMLP